MIDNTASEIINLAEQKLATENTDIPTQSNLINLIWISLNHVECT